MADAKRDPAQLLADQFARAASRRIDDILRDMWSNDDAGKVLVSRSILTWLEEGTIGLPYSIDELRPETMEDIWRGAKHGLRASLGRVRCRFRAQAHTSCRAPALTRIGKSCRLIRNQRHEYRIVAAQASSDHRNLSAGSTRAAA